MFWQVVFAVLLFGLVVTLMCVVAALDNIRKAIEDHMLVQQQYMRGE